MGTNQLWNWRLTVLKTIKTLLLRPRMANGKRTIKADCAVSKQSPFPLSIKALVPWLSGSGRSRPVDRGPKPQSTRQSVESVWQDPWFCCLCLWPGWGCLLACKVWIQEHTWARGRLRHDGGLGPASSFSAVTLELPLSLCVAAALGTVWAGSLSYIPGKLNSANYPHVSAPVGRSNSQSDFVP